MPQLWTMDVSPFHNSHYNDALQNSGGGCEISKQILIQKKRKKAFLLMETFFFLSRSLIRDKLQHKKNEKNVLAFHNWAHGKCTIPSPCLTPNGL